MLDWRDGVGGAGDDEAGARERFSLFNTGILVTPLYAGLSRMEWVSERWSVPHGGWKVMVRGGGGGTGRFGQAWIWELHRENIGRDRWLIYAGL